METWTNADWIAAFAAYLTRRFPGRSTAKHYVSDMQLFVDQYPQPLATITRREIDAFIDTQHARGLAPTTVKRRAAALKTFFDFLADELQQPQRANPLQMRRHAGRQPHLLPRDLTDSEVAAFLAVIDEERDRAMVALMLYAGLRVGEVAALHRADLTVSAQAQAPVRLRVLGKGQKERVVYLCAHGYRALAGYLQSHPPASAHAALFRTRLGTGVSVAGMQERVGQYAQRCGVEVTCHRLRHTYGRWLAEGQMPVLALSRLLGHASLQTSQRSIDGADPQVRRSYLAAWERSSLPLSQSNPTPDLLPAPVNGPAQAAAWPRPPWTQPAGCHRRLVRYARRWWPGSRTRRRAGSRRNASTTRSSGWANCECSGSGSWPTGRSHPGLI